MVDHGLTKGIILCPTKKMVTAEGIATFFFYKVYLCFRLYDKIISDCGPQFASTFTKELVMQNVQGGLFTKQTIVGDTH